MTFNPIIPVVLMILITGFLVTIVVLNKKNMVIRLIIIALLFITNLRPMKLSQKIEVYSTNLDILFVIDTTVSMDTVDMNGTRLSRVKSDINYIMNEFTGSNFALITFNNVSTIISPFTFDTKRIETAINNLETGDILYANGTNLDEPVESMKMLLETSSKRENKTILFFISDGEFNKNADFSLYKSISHLISNGAVLGYGTKTGGKIRLNLKNKDYYSYRVDNDGYLLDRKKYPYVPAISKMDENNLKKLSQTLSVNYINMNNRNNINQTISNIKNGLTYNINNSEASGGEDLYYYVSFILIPLFLYELVIYRREL